MPRQDGESLSVEVGIPKERRPDNNVGEEDAAVEGEGSGDVHFQILLISCFMLGLMISKAVCQHLLLLPLVLEEDKSRTSHRFALPITLHIHAFVESLHYLRKVPPGIVISVLLPCLPEHLQA